MGDIRLATIREICRQEGHGELVETTTLRDYGARSEYLCQRGCGVKILSLRWAHTVEEVQQRLGDGGVIRLRGDVELWPANEEA